MTESPSLPGLSVLAVFLLLVLGGASCQAPEFYQREDLSRVVMRLEAPPGSELFQRKVFQSIEGAAGGFGHGAGGGCGCN